MERCQYLSVNENDVICTAVNPPIILGDIMGYSGFACSVCKQKFDELKKNQENDRKREIEDFYNFIMSKKIRAAKNRPQIKEERMKTEKFQMRISKETKMKLVQLAKYYNLSASAVIDMLISKEAREHLQDMEVPIRRNLV